jgi:hypothetical protein
LIYVGRWYARSISTCRFHPDRLYVLGCVTPVALGLEVAEIELVLEPELDTGDRLGDFAAYKRLSTARRLVTEKEPIDGEHSVGFAVIVGDKGAKRVGRATTRIRAWAPTASGVRCSRGQEVTLHDRRWPMLGAGALLLVAAGVDLILDRTPTRGDPERYVHPNDDHRGRDLPPSSPPRQPAIAALRDRHARQRARPSFAAR